MKYQIIDNCAVPDGIAPAVLELKRRVPGAALNSCDRSRAAEPILKQFGKKSQQQLYDCFVRSRQLGHCPPECGGDCNPANPPGRSTHERRSDGVAFAGPAGRPLAPWQVGMDWNMPGEVLRAATAIGYVATLTYPTNPRESQHLNFRNAPLAKLVPVLRLGSSGPRVLMLTRRLAATPSPHTRQAYLPAATKAFDATVDAAVRAFQADHQLDVDGVVGPATLSQLAVACRRERRVRKDRGAQRAVAAGMSAQDKLVLRVLDQHGIAQPEVAMREARRTGIMVRLAAAILEQESGGGQNVFGHDAVRAPQLVGGEVTQERYKRYLELRQKGLGAQGVGPCQLTYPGFQDEADRLGGCWKPQFNMRVGFSNLKTLTDRYGYEDGIRRYNGAGDAAVRYSQQVRGRVDQWTIRMKQEGVKL